MNNLDSTAHPLTAKDVAQAATTVAGTATPQLTLNDLGARHYAWVERMNWHNKSVLDSMALIGSEVGESADECLMGYPLPAFGEELADIILRTLDLAQCEGIDIDDEVARTQVQWRGATLPQYMNELTIEWAQWVNTARVLPPEGKTMAAIPAFCHGMARLIMRVQQLAEAYNVDLTAEVLRKMDINERRGTRGRHI